MKTNSENVTFTIVKKKNKWLIEKKNRTMVDIATAYWNEGVDDAADEWVNDLEENYWYY